MPGPLGKLWNPGSVVLGCIYDCVFVSKDLVGRLSLSDMVAQMSHGGARNNGLYMCVESV